MNIMLKITQLIDAMLDKGRTVLTVDLFKYIENLFVNAAGFAAMAASALGALIIIIVAIRTDSLSLFLSAPIWVIVVTLSYYIGEKILQSCIKSIKNNPSSLGSRDVLDVLAVFTAIAAISSLLIGAFIAVKASSSSLFFIGLGGSIIFTYACWIYLNPNILSTEIKANASAGDEAIAYAAFFHKFYLRLAKIFFGMLPLIGALMLIGTLGQSFGDNPHALVYGGVTAAIGFPLILGGLLAPLGLYILFIFSYIWIDVLRSILSIPAEKNSLKGHSDGEDSENPIPEQTKAILKIVGLALAGLLILVVGSIQVKAIYTSLNNKWENHKLEKAMEERELAQKLEIEKELQAAEAAKKEQEAQAAKQIQDFVALARKHINQESLNLVLEPEINTHYREFFGSRLKDFESLFSQSLSKVKESEGFVIAEGCMQDACDSYRAITVVDTKTGKVMTTTQFGDRTQYFGTNESEAPAILKKWAIQQAYAQSHPQP